MGSAPQTSAAVMGDNGVSASGSQQLLRKSRRELEVVVDEQKDQLQKYETRLRDLVRAYKGLAKEKEALDAVIRNTNSSSAVKDASSSGAADKDTGTAAMAANEALKTITAEKNRLEVMFQEDKKRTLAEKECNFWQRL